MFAAEFADKTSLLAVSIATKSKRPMIVYLGSLTGIIFTSIIGVLFALLLGQAIPDFIGIISGLVFLYLGISNLFHKENNHNEEVDYISVDSNDKNLTSFKLYLKSSLIIAIAEFGDKSQIFLIAGASIQSPFAIFLGAIIGIGVVLAISIYFGDKLLEKVPEEKLETFVGIVFIIVGILILANYIFLK